MKTQMEKIQKKFDSSCKDINFEFLSEETKKLAFLCFLRGFIASEDSISKAGEKYKEAAGLVIDHLNSEKQKISKNTLGGLKLTPAIQKTIAARIKEGFTVEELKLVIDFKCFKWKGTDLEQYIRPSTLFSAKKFPEYVSESMHFKKPVRSKMDNDLEKLLEN